MRGHAGSGPLQIEPVHPGQEIIGASVVSRPRSSPMSPRHRVSELRPGGRAAKDFGPPAAHDPDLVPTSRRVELFYAGSRRKSRSLLSRGRGRRRARAPALQRSAGSGSACRPLFRIVPCRQSVAGAGGPPIKTKVWNSPPVARPSRLAPCHRRGVLAPAAHRPPAILPCLHVCANNTPPHHVMRGRRSPQEPARPRKKFEPAIRRIALEPCP